MIDHHHNGFAMARCLAGYIDDPLRIQREVRAAGLKAPAKTEIAEIMARRKQKAERPSFKPHEGYNPNEVRDRLSIANQRYINAVWRSHPRVMLVAQALGRTVAQPRKDV